MILIKDKDPIFFTDEYDVVLLGTSTACSLASGFQGKLARKYPYIDAENDKQPYRDNRRLGTRLTLKEEGKPIISLMYVSKYNDSRNVTIDYEALTNCLSTANAEFKGKKVITTIVGSTKVDGNGEREKCLKILEKCTKDLDIDVYDYEQLTYSEEVAKVIRPLSDKWIKEKIRTTKKQRIEERQKLLKENYLNKVNYGGETY